MNSGLVNCRSTCYINTALQCLGHCKQFTTKLLSLENVTSTHHKIVHALRETYHDLALNDAKATDPAPLLHILQKRFGKSMFLFQQNDVVEFLTILLDEINKEIGVDISSFRVEDKHTTAAIMLRAWIATHRRAMSFVCDMFYGQNVQQIKCPICLHIEQSAETFSCLALDMMQQTSTTKDLAQLIAHTFACETVEYKCEKCQGARAVRSQRLWRPPQILVIHLKRFHDLANKLTTPVDVPATISLDFKINDCQKYTLCAIACHSGTLNYGHCFALCRTVQDAGVDKWHLYDDDARPKLLSSYTDINSSQYYALFYEKSFERAR